MYNPQLNAHGELQHLLTIEGLPRAILCQILDTASGYLQDNPDGGRKFEDLRGKSVFNLFF
jgi:aspartate carbamoyltransferase catalytic subunit